MSLSVVQRLTSGRRPGGFRSYTDNTSLIPDQDVEPGSSKQLSSQIPHETNFKPTPKLVKFRNLIGIQSTRTNLLGRPAPNPGIYKRTIKDEKDIQFKLRLSSYIVNVLFLLQIVVGAALTALGAAKGSTIAVTILGAVNTVVAGILTYLKGQGLPTRFEQNLHLLRTLREHIEEREREFTEHDCILDVDEVVQSIIQMYKEVRQTAKDNAPGTVLPPKGVIEGLMKKKEAGNNIPKAEGTGGKNVRDRLEEPQKAGKQASPETVRNTEGS